jgi:hypothetical protein
MAYRIEFADRAARNLEAPYVEKNAAESQMAFQWYQGLKPEVNLSGLRAHQFSPDSARTHMFIG